MTLLTHIKQCFIVGDSLLSRCFYGKTIERGNTKLTTKEPLKISNSALQNHALLITSWFQLHTFIFLKIDSWNVPIHSAPVEFLYLRRVLAYAQSGVLMGFILICSKGVRDEPVREGAKV